MDKKPIPAANNNNNQPSAVKNPNDPQTTKTQVNEAPNPQQPNSAEQQPNQGESAVNPPAEEKKEVKKKVFKPYDNIKELTIDHIVSFCFPKRFPSKKNESGLRLFLIEKNISRVCHFYRFLVFFATKLTNFHRNISYVYKMMEKLRF